MPLLKTRVAVEWKTATIKKGNDAGTHGCLYPEARAIGNVNGVVGADYKKQIIDLLSSGPHKSGSLEEMLTLVGTSATKLLATSPAPTPSQKTELFADLESGAIASKKGIQAWYKDLEDHFGKNLTEILGDKATLAQDLITKLADAEICAKNKNCTIQQLDNLVNIKEEFTKIKDEIQKLIDELLIVEDFPIESISNNTSSSNKATSNARQMTASLGEVLTENKIIQLTSGEVITIKAGVNFESKNGSWFINGVEYKLVRDKSTGKFRCLYKQTYLSKPTPAPCTILKSTLSNIRDEYFDYCEEGRLMPGNEYQVDIYGVECKEIEAIVTDNVGSIAYHVNLSSFECLKKIDFSYRKTLLMTLAKSIGGSLSGEYDVSKASIKLLESVGADKYAEILSWLKEKSSYDGTKSLLTVYLENVDESMSDFAFLLPEMMGDKILNYTHESNSNSTTTERIIFNWGRSIQTATGIPVIGYYLVSRRYDGEVKGSLIVINKTDLVQTGNDPFGQELSTPDESPALDPYQIIEVRMEDDFNFGLETIFKRGDQLVIPVITFYALIKQKKARDLSLQIKLATMAVTLPLTVVSGGGWGAAFLLLDNTVLGADIMINDANVGNMKAKYPNFVNAFNDLKNLYFAGRATIAIVQSAQALSNIITNMKASGTLTAEELTNVIAAENMLNRALTTQTSPTLETFGFNSSRITAGREIAFPSNGFTNGGISNLAEVPRFRSVIQSSGTEAFATMFEPIQTKVIPLVAKEVSLEMEVATQTAIAKSYKLATSLETDILTVTLNNGVNVLVYASQNAVEQAETEKNNCNYCRTQNKLLCTQLKNLSQSTGKDAAVKKLCSSSISDVLLSAIITKLNSMGNKTTFLSEIEGSNCTTAYLCGNVNLLTVDIIEAWEVVYEAKPTAKFKQDYATLVAVKTIRINPNKLAAFTNNSGTISSFIEKYAQSRCKICGNQGLAYLPELDNILLNTAEVYEKHHTTPNFMGWYNREVFASNISYEIEPEGEVRNIPSIGRDGAQHMIKYMAERPFADNTTGIDQNFDPTAAYPNRQYDIKVGDQITFVEFKSYKTTTSLNTTASAEQLMSYLSKIASMAELRYVFNDRKTSITEAKTKMQGLFQGGKKDEIFEVIWRKNDLRESLFGVIDPILLSTQKPIKRAIYDDWLINFDNNIFKIVDVN